MLVQDTFADNMRDLRIRAGLSQEMLAEKSGLHRTYIGSIEQKRANISLKSVERIAEALEVEPAVLFIAGAAGHENDAANHASNVEAFVNEASRFETGEFALCEWGEGGSLHFEPINVQNEDLTLRILCTLIEEGYGKTLDDLVAAYDEVSAPVLEFLRTYRGPENR